MNSETLRMVDPDLAKAVKIVADEDVPTGQVAVLMEDGTTERVPVDAWQASVRAELVRLRRTRQQEQARLRDAATRRRREAHRRERCNRRDGRRQRRAGTRGRD